ncbi:TetR/AcrR family transcriptional regulator C-terminal ligand-binding domain-containing protein [Streptomyces sp. NA02950]|uniref:TetR-like C-terminal domain-containing protein n=1 Tax=Streptomyces sp. NA02950 TaxID=2742137 RepID=UPI001590EEC7|nr:TetR-like C-terminal domain-containing protein [Streptomyces sp. NA02950]QKV90836.1 TetR/AcrR family transcriptional regulator C-terminal ligand-binding domain-containing protein [Streptomyces sp. NA02950]
MTERPPHGSARPGGRTARTRTAVLTAALDELDVAGFGALTLDKLAVRSGVHVSTIRRRWRTVEGVIGDLLAQQSTTIPTPDSGGLRQDLHELASAIADFHATPRNRNLIEGIAAAAAHDPRVADIVRGAFTARTEHVTQLVQRAVARGELTADTDAKEVIAALSAPFYYRILILRGTVDARLVHTSAEAAYLAARAGAFGPPETETSCRTRKDTPHEGAPTAVLRAHA